MNHPYTLQSLANERQSDLLAEARRARLVRSAKVRSEHVAARTPRPRLRHGLATTMLATSAALVAVVVRPF